MTPTTLTSAGEAIAERVRCPVLVPKRVSGATSVALLLSWGCDTLAVATGGRRGVLAAVVERAGGGNDVEERESVGDPAWRRDSGHALDGPDVAARLADR